MAPKKGKKTEDRAIETGRMLFDESLTSAAIALANPDIQSQNQAAALFRESAKGRYFFNFDRASYEGLTTAEQLSRQRKQEDSVLDGKSRDDALTFDAYDWDVAQRRLQNWLPKIAEADRLPESTARALRREISEALSSVEPIGLRLGSSDLFLHIQNDTIYAASVRAILPFLLPYGWSPRRIARCELNTCQHWFLRANKSGPREMYCTDKHRNLAKTRRFRGKQA